MASVPPPSAADSGNPTPQSPKKQVTPPFSLVLLHASLPFVANYFEGFVRWKFKVLRTMRFSMRMKKGLTLLMMALSKLFFNFLRVSSLSVSLSPVLLNCLFGVLRKIIFFFALCEFYRDLRLKKFFF